MIIIVYHHSGGVQASHKLASSTDCHQVKSYYEKVGRRKLYQTYVDCIEMIDENIKESTNE